MQKEFKEKIGLRKGKSTFGILSIVFFLTLLIPFSLAIISTNYNINITAITGGGTSTNSTDYSLLTAINQIIGSITSTDYKIKLGFVPSSNSAPSNTTIPDQTWYQDNALELDLNDYFSDLDGDSLTYTSTTPSNIQVSISSNIATLTPNTGWYGTNYITFTASDGVDTTQSNNVTLTVNQVTVEEEEEEKVPQISYRGSSGPALPSKREFAIKPGLMVLTNFPYDSALESIEINVLFAGENAKLIAHELPKVNVPRINAYTFLEILAFDIYFDKAVITFKVDNKWIASKNIDEDSVTLMLFDSTWIPLTTQKIRTSQGYAYFKAETSKFGVFGITGKTKLFEPIREPIKEPVKKIGEITATVTKELGKEEITKILKKIGWQRIPYIGGAGIIILITITVIIFYKRVERKLKMIRKLMFLGKIEKVEKLYKKIPEQDDIEYYLTEYRVQKEIREREFKELLEVAERKIKQAIKYGYTKKQIIESFLQKGWDKKVIKGLLNSLEEKTEKESYYYNFNKENKLNKPKKGIKFNKVLLILLLTLLVSSGIFFLLNGGIGNINSWIDKGTNIIKGSVGTLGSDITGFVVYNPQENLSLEETFTKEAFLTGDDKNLGSYNETLVYEVNEGTATFQTLATTNIPKKMNLQGKLTDSSGNVLTGSYMFKFTIYDAYTSGTRLWTENQTLTTSKGIFDTTLGSVNALNLTFEDPYYLGIVVSGDSEMTPRINFSTNPYAFRANTTDYYHVVDEITSDDYLYLNDDVNVSGFLNVTKGATFTEDVILNTKILSDDTLFLDDAVNVSGILTVNTYALGNGSDFDALYGESAGAGITNDTDDLINFSRFSANSYRLGNGSTFDVIYGESDTDTTAYADWRNASMLTFINNTDDFMNFSEVGANKFTLGNGSDFDTLYGGGGTTNDTYTGCGLNGVACTFDDDTIDTNKNITTDEDVLPKTDKTGNLGRNILRWLKGWFMDLQVDNAITSDDTLFLNDDVNITGDLNVTGTVELGDSGVLKFNSTGFFQYNLTHWKKVRTDSAVPQNTIAAFYQDSCPDGWILADGTSSTPDLDNEYNETGWLFTNNWTNVHLGTTNGSDSNFFHGLDTPLSDVLVKVLISTDGTDDNAQEMGHLGESAGAIQRGIRIEQIDDDNIKVQTGEEGLVELDDDGVGNQIDTEPWFYKISAQKKRAFGGNRTSFTYCMKTADDSADTTASIGSTSDYVFVQNDTKDFYVGDQAITLGTNGSIMGNGTMNIDLRSNSTLNADTNGWLFTNDWTNVHLGTTNGSDSNFFHGLNAPLSDLLVKVLISTDGTDANSFEVTDASIQDTGGNAYGATIYNIDNNNIKVQTSANGITYVDDNGVTQAIAAQDWYYKIKVWKLG